MTIQTRSAGHETCHHRIYRLTCEAYESLLARASGQCELCLTPAKQTGIGKLLIDHEHRIGVQAVRGLLCEGCNAHMRRVDSGERPMSWEVAAYLLLSGHVLPPGVTRSAVGAGVSRTVRIPKADWDAFGEACRLFGSNRTEQVIGFMRWMARHPGAKLPKRPEVPSAASS